MSTTPHNENGYVYHTVDGTTCRLVRDRRCGRVLAYKTADDLFPFARFYTMDEAVRACHDLVA